MGSIDLRLIFFEIVEVQLNRFEMIMVGNLMLKRKFLSGAIRGRIFFVDSIDSFRFGLGKEVSLRIFEFHPGNPEDTRE